MGVRYIDLFAGIGGMRLAFEPYGECVFSCEWDKKAQDMYEMNFGERPFGDIRYVSGWDIPDHDILIGAFPCQPFSNVHPNNLPLEELFNGIKDTLFFDIVRILRNKSPNAFLLENVKGLLTHEKGKTFEIILEVLKGLGYTVFYKVINSKTLVPQNKERVYIVGFNKNIDFEFPQIPDNSLALKTILEKYVDEKYTLSDLKWNIIRKRKNRWGSRYNLADINSYCNTFTGRDPYQVLIPQFGNNPRGLTPRELARLQGFPEYYMINVSDYDAFRLFGNSSTAPVVSLIAKKIVQTLTEYYGTQPIEPNEGFDIEQSYIEVQNQSQLYSDILEYSSMLVRFPTTGEIALKAREFYFDSNKEAWNPDSVLLDWIKIEYEIFKAMEEHLYQDFVKKPFGSVENLIGPANTILNRRKSRAGKSLEHHIDYILSHFNIPFSHPGISEGNKSPDFLFPSNQAYADKSFPDNDLTFLGAKTTCKDRWRQILNEAERIPNKFLITLQKGISSNQLMEMKEHNVTLVVPQKYHELYPVEHRKDLLTVKMFLDFLLEKYKNHEILTSSFLK
jgi:DNA (cytosine-5)-methyltransferase 1